MNKVVLMGRITRDIELKSTPTGVSYTDFTLAVDRGYKGSDGQRQTDFIRCVAWRSTAEFISKYFSKGRMIAVGGRVQCRDYTDNNGIKRYLTEIYVEDAYFTGEKSTSNAEDTFFEITDDENLPF